MPQMEKSVAGEAEDLGEQQKVVALARVRLHEQQMEMALQARFYFFVALSGEETARHGTNWYFACRMFP